MGDAQIHVYGVADVELVYRTGDYEEYFMPYYVPAVDGRYISNMPTWDGSFN